MSDQGWMVDDDTCGPCLHGLCYRCTNPQEWPPSNDLDLRVSLTCCCNEAQHLGYLDFITDDIEPTQEADR